MAVSGLFWCVKILLKQYLLLKFDITLLIKVIITSKVVILFKEWKKQKHVNHVLGQLLNLILLKWIFTQRRVF